MASQRSKPVNIRGREVQAAVDRAQHRRQGMIFAVQGLFAANIALVYRATSHVSDQELLKSSGAALFACYAAFSVWCVFRSSQRRLRWWDVTLSTILDYSLYTMVVMQLANTPIQHGQAFVTAPLFAFVYLFIAVRCLHYHPGHVYLAGALATGAWCLLILNANSGSAAGAYAATRSLSFTEAVLSGAIDKLISIVAVTWILAICVKEARKHLYSSVIRGVAGKGLARMVGEDVAMEVLFSKEALVPGRGKHQTVAILMMDIRNFTKIAARADPSDVIAMLATYQQIAEPVIVKYGGCIDKFMGDGILAHFGALEPNPRYVAQALKCVEALLFETDRWNGRRLASGFKPFQFRVACAVGEAVVGLVGGTTKVEFTIIGDPVNTTAKLEKHAKKLEARALTTARAFDMARHQGFTPSYPIRIVNGEHVAGVEVPMDLVVLGDLASSAKPRASGKKQVSANRTKLSKTTKAAS